MLSLIVPVYRSEENLPRLFDALTRLAGQLPRPLEVVFVVDGSPDRSREILAGRLPSWPVQSQLLELSRNFGSFAAIGAGLAAARGDFVAVIAADLQEPPELVIEFEKILASGAADVVFGRRERRRDPWLSQLLSSAFWG